MSDVRRSLARASRIALALALAAAGTPAKAQVFARPVAIYPFASGGGDAADAQSLLEAALHRAAQRSEDIVVASPLFVRASCGPAASATAECLGRLAGSGFVLRATVHRSGSSLIVVMDAVDGTGRAFGPASAGMDAFIQNAEPLTRGILLLADQVLSAERRRVAQRHGAPSEPAPVATIPLPPAPAARPAPGAEQPAAAPAPRAPPEAAPPAAAAAPPRAAQASGADLRAPAPPPPAPAPAAPARRPARGAWMRALAPWCAIGGIALLGGGAVISSMNASLSRELEQKFEEGTLGPSDLASYDRVDRYNRLSRALLLSGGALAVTGAVLVAIAPEPGGVSVGVAGRF